MAVRERKRAISDAEVAAHRFIEGKSPLLWDSGTGSCGGFFVRATKAGRQYGFQFRVGDKNKRLSLGPTTKFASIADARKLAADKLARWHQQQIDPAIGSSGTLADVWTYYITTLKTGRGRKGKQRAGRPASPKSILEAENHWRVHLEPVIGALPPNKLTKALVRRIHADISEPRRVKPKGRGAVRKGGGYAANRTMESLRAAWRCGMKAGICTGDPFEAYEPNAEVARKVYVKQVDAPAVLASIDQEAPVLRAYFRLLLLLGPRSGELRAIEWPDVDLERRVLTLRGVTPEHGTKNHDVLTLPLTTAAVELLRTIPKAHARRVFPFSRPKSQWKRILKRAGMEGVRMHDIRRSVGTWLGAAGLSSTAVGAVLGHKSDITSRVYISLAGDDATKLAALELQSQAVERAGAANVVSLDERRGKRRGKAA